MESRRQLWGAAIGAFVGAALGLIIARVIAGPGIWVYIGIALESPSGQLQGKPWPEDRQILQQVLRGGFTELLRARLLGNLELPEMPILGNPVKPRPAQGDSRVPIERVTRIGRGRVSAGRCHTSIPPAMDLQSPPCGCLTAS